MRSAMLLNSARGAPALCRAYAAAAAAGAGPPRVALVQGSSRGLGLEFVRQLLLQPDISSVVATCRTPAASEGLQALQRQQPGRLQIVPLDSTDELSIAAAAEQVSAAHQHLDILINASGILHDAGMQPETGLARITMDSLTKCFQVNAAGHILVCQAFAPLLINAAAANGATEERPAVIANLSARVGSIGDNRLGGWYSYRASKSAINQLTKCMSLEFERRRHKVACLLLHPGTVDTDLSKPFQRNVAPEKLFSRERAVSQLLGIIQGATIADNGKYLDWKGTEIEW